MPSREYWAKRAEELLTESFKKAETSEKYLVGIYRSSLIKVSNEYSALVKPFLDENGELDIDKLNQAKQDEQRQSNRASQVQHHARQTEGEDR